MTRNTKRTHIFAIKHFEHPELDQTSNFLCCEEIESIMSAMARQEKNASNGAPAPPPRTPSTDSFTSVRSDLSAVSRTSTDNTTPTHSRASSLHDLSKPSIISLEHLSAALEHTALTRSDPWTREYPRPAQDIDIAAFLARKKLPGSPYERLQAARDAMSPAQRSEYDAKKKVESEERWKVHNKKRFEETIQNLTRPMGYAAVFNRDEPIRRPDTFMNGYGYYEEFDTKQGHFKEIPGQKERYALYPPASKQVEEEKMKRQKDVEMMRYD